MKSRIREHEEAAAHLPGGAGQSRPCDAPHDHINLKMKNTLPPYLWHSKLSKYFGLTIEEVFDFSDMEDMDDESI